MATSITASGGSGSVTTEYCLLLNFELDFLILGFRHGVLRHCRQPSVKIVLVIGKGSRDLGH
jgi:hypothetical protein